jgi:lysozyme
VTAQELQRLELQLVAHEGLRTVLYRCTSGKLTIGVGYNVDDRGLGPMSAALGRTVTIEELRARGISREDALTVLRADIARFVRAIRQAWPSFDRLNGVRQRCVVDFVFNVGGAGALKFRQAMRFVHMAIEQPNPDLAEACYTAVAFHLADSIWARQVDDGLAGRKGRADRLVHMMRTGLDGAAA